MASANKVGHADRPLTVRDPVVADIVLPRFLAPGDHALAALNINNVEGKPGDYTATVTATSPVALPGNTPTVISRRLAVGQRILIPVELGANGIGIASVGLKLTGPGGFAVSRSWPIQSRAPQLDMARDETVPLAPNQSYTADKALVADLIPGTQSVALTVSAAHGYSNVPGLLKWLDKYPYGCIEQTTSRAMPLLVFNDLADLAGLPRDRALHDRVQEAVDAVLDMQNYAGNFGMWAPGTDAEPWISVFALDFLYQAKLKGYVVANDPLRRGTSWLKTTASSDSADDATRAYAFYLLARNGQVNLSDLRYFSDTRGPEMKTAIAAALTGAAAAEAGDRSRATAGFLHARDVALSAKPESYSDGDYGSLLRDLAGSTALAAESGEAQLIPALMQKSDTLDMRLNATTTQEKAWMLRAAYELTRQRTPLNILVGGKPAMPRDGAIRLSPSMGQLSSGLTLLNKGDAGVWRTVSVQGTPALPLPAAADGLTLAKSVWTMSGTPADLANLHQNDRVIVLLNGQMPNNYAHQMGAIDLLPAGLEIEQKLTADDAKPYPWLQTLSRHLDAGFARRSIRRRLHHRLALSRQQRRREQEARTAADLPPRLHRPRRDHGHLRDAGRRGRGHVRTGRAGAHDAGQRDDQVVEKDGLRAPASVGRYNRNGSSEEFSLMHIRQVVSFGVPALLPRLRLQLRFGRTCQDLRPDLGANRRVRLRWTDRFGDGAGHRDRGTPVRVRNRRRRRGRARSHGQG